MTIYSRNDSGRAITRRLKFRLLSVEAAPPPGSLHLNRDPANLTAERVGMGLNPLCDLLPQEQAQVFASGSIWMGR